MEMTTGVPPQQADESTPLRVLVQTKTHLVLGENLEADYATKVDFMKNLICRHLWNRDFDKRRERWNSHGDQFGYSDRDCWFLIDHGDSVDEPPVLWYKWTGESLSETHPLFTKS